MDTPNKKPSLLAVRWRKLRAWVTQHKKASIAIAIAVVLLIGSGVAAAVYFWPKEAPAPAPKKQVVKKEAPKPKFYSPLTGKEVADKGATTANVTAVMIENSPDARPQSGLKRADVVYEAIAEAGITRFAALYQQERPELIGPVRSLRMYYLDWIAPYDASIAHVGGSLFSLQEVRNGSHRDIDQFFNAGTYWRSDDRYAPHNVYTSFANIDALNKEKSYTQSKPQAIARQDKMPAGGAVANLVNVIMSSGTYNSSWNYDAKSKQYLRSQGGEPHVDREEGQISREVVVVLKMQMDHVMEDGLRENYHASGTGDAVVFANGTAHEVTWHKENMRTQFSFTNKSDGKEFKLPRGSTWFSAIPVNDGGSVGWQ